MALSLVVTSCAGTSGTDDTGATTVASTATTTSTTTTSLPEPDWPSEVTEDEQMFLFLTDDDLLTEMRTFVVTEAEETGDGTARFFDSAEVRWVESASTDYRLPDWYLESETDPVELSSGTVVFATSGEASEFFRSSTGSVGEPAEHPDGYDDVSVFVVGDVGNEAVGLDLHTYWFEGLEYWERQVVFRRGPVIGAVTMTSDRVDEIERDALADLARRLDEKIILALEGDLEAPTLPITTNSPTAQLSSFTFELTAMDDRNGMITLRGGFVAPAFMRCELDFGEGPPVQLVSDGNGIAVLDDTTWTYLSEEDAESVAMFCPSYPGFWEYDYYLFDEISFWTLGVLDEEPEQPWEDRSLHGRSVRYYDGRWMPEFVAPELPGIDTFAFWFDAEGGWLARAEISGPVEVVEALGANLLMAEGSRVTYVLQIERPNDPSIEEELEIPERIADAA